MKDSFLIMLNAPIYPPQLRARPVRTRLQNSAYSPFIHVLYLACCLHTCASI